ncbi:hypothetical protein C7C46_04830 [Streptomyces tateyamensis]|uniref:Methyltransferase domain-containing protein n=1 Tax=Streptomyces tateyamensis TaxID=565073 RepID=A0A2V4PMJ5_9ACTN|nr:class I SAM-dependent methyltransferase [Streptomyces tateyamensis]PYC87408.1 hypothetical protein C7C46_04830 [Streptomyces tateyamensis]
MTTTTGFYDGLIGAVYAAAIADQLFDEDALFTRIVAEARGTALELGSGTGRLMLRLLQAGHQVHGLEISEEMIGICRADAARQGLVPTIHQGSFAPLDAELSGYAALYCPLNGFAFITDDELALASVLSYAAALAPGGILALAGSAGDARLRSSAEWVRRPDVPIAGGLVAQVDERRTVDTAERCLKVERTITVRDADGRTTAEEDGVQWRRLRPIAELAELFAQAGLTGLHAYGSDADHILTGRK